MILAKIDENRIVLNTIVASLDDVLPEGTWVECPEWVGIGMSVDIPKPVEPEPPNVDAATDQPNVTGTQTL